MRWGTEMLGYRIGSPIMMTLGSFQFGINTAAYQELSKNSEWRWPSQDRFGLPPALQFVGPGAESITLPGVIYTEWRGGVGQIDSMRSQASQGEPLAMISGQGEYLGLWVIEGIEEKHSSFGDAGVARKQEFTLKLKRFYDAQAAMPVLPQSVKQSVSDGIKIPENATTVASKTQGLASSIILSARTLSASAMKAYQDVQGISTPYTTIARDATGGALRVVSVATEMQTTANRLLAIVGKSPVDVTAISAAQTLASKSTMLLVSADSASALLKHTAGRLEVMSGAKASDVQATRSAANTAAQASALCRASINSAKQIAG
jgi:phage protein U